MLLVLINKCLIYRYPQKKSEYVCKRLFIWFNNNNNFNLYVCSGLGYIVGSKVSGLFTGPSAWQWALRVSLLTKQTQFFLLCVLFDICPRKSYDIFNLPFMLFFKHLKTLKLLGYSSAWRCCSFIDIDCNSWTKTWCSGDRN